jgi:hypothetical protein
MERQALTLHNPRPSLTFVDPHNQKSILEFLISSPPIFEATELKPYLLNPSLINQINALEKPLFWNNR